jgi:uncharacterized protein YcnI
MTSRALHRLAAIAAISLAVPAVAGAHARVSPAVSLKGKLQYYTLAVPTEKEGVTTAKVQITFPSGFGVDSFAPPPPGWTFATKQSGSGEAAVVTQATWTGGKTPTNEDSVFGFLAQPASSGTYKFNVEQTYSDGSIVEWTDPESGQDPAPTIQAVSSMSGGGTSVLTIVALVVGVLGLLAGGTALTGRSGGGRELA